MKLRIFVILISLISFNILQAQKHNHDAVIVGHVVSEGEHLPFANIAIKGTTIGTTTDETGHYQLVNVPIGEITVVASMLGYKSSEITITTKEDETKEIKFELEIDPLGLNEVVVTGNRQQTNRKASSVIVTTVSPKLFSNVQANTLSEGLNFAPGLRMENNCQNCGFSQIRMNGMEGPYSQILINSRPIFSGLAGVYGLELIPANMIERVEIIRGGGSALYGSNAIAGVINLILKDPITNSYEIGTNVENIGIGVKNSGKPAQDYSVNFNTSLVSRNHKTGLSLYGFYRDRAPFDANNDDFSEIAKLNNNTLGARFYHRFTNKDKLTLDFFNIKESRRGGNKFETVEHETDITEGVKHNITSGSVNYEHFINTHDIWSVYLSGQKVNRDSYYGAEQSLKDYGNSTDFTYAVGSQYNAHFGSMFKLVAGVEWNGGKLKDIKKGYPDFENAIINPDSTITINHTENMLIADQVSNTVGAFAQFDVQLDKLLISLGARFDHFEVKDTGYTHENKTGNVLSPRLSLKYDIVKNLQARVSYSQGYRSPQIFDEDLHIETSGSRQVLHKNDPNLTKETSHGFLASLNYNKTWGTTGIDVLIEGFYTLLKNPFANEFGEPDENGVVTYTRVNAEKGAYVSGVNLELKYIPIKNIDINLGFTVQQSLYEEEQDFDEKRFFRTPNDYGYLSMNWEVTPSFGFSTTANYTGKMLIPYFGIGLPNPDEGILKESKSFFDMGMKLHYNLKFSTSKMQIFAGVKNIFNSYQDDFDTGVSRDPGYTYGPMLPRTIYAGVKIGNLL